MARGCYFCCCSASRQCLPEILCECVLPVRHPWRRNHHRQPRVSSCTQVPSFLRSSHHHHPSCVFFLLVFICSPFSIKAERPYIVMCSLWAFVFSIILQYIVVLSTHHSHMPYPHACHHDGIIAIQCDVMERNALAPGSSFLRAFAILMGAVEVCFFIFYTVRCH